MLVTAAKEASNISAVVSQVHRTRWFDLFYRDIHAIDTVHVQHVLKQRLLSWDGSSEIRPAAIHPVWQSVKCD